MAAKIISPFLERSIDLCDADGNVVETVTYRLNVLRAFEAITEAQAALNAAIKDGDAETIGKRFTALMEAVFGREAAARIIAFYGAETIEDANNLVWLVTPIMIDDIFPALIKQREQILDSRRALKRYGADV